MVTKSAPYYPDAKSNTSFEDGLEFQDFVADVLRKELGIVITNYASRKWQFNVGENRQGIEIKLDRRMTETGNVSIEVGEKSYAGRADYTPSGILRNDNSWLYVQGNKETILIFAKKTLLDAYYSGRYRVNELPTIKRFLVRLDEAITMAAKVLYPNGGK